MHHFTRQSASFHPIKYGRLHNDLHQSILPLVINIITTPDKLIRHYKYPNTQRLRRCANIQMDVFAMMNVLTTQRRRCYVGIPTNVFDNINALIAQRRGCYVGIAMNVFDIINALMVQRRRCRANILINTSVTMNALTMQRCKRCTFYSPGLASESESYPGSFAASGNNAVGVVHFIPRYFITAFHAENVQHLRR